MFNMLNATVQVSFQPIRAEIKGLVRKNHFKTQNEPGPS